MRDECVERAPQVEWRDDFTWECLEASDEVVVLEEWLRFPARPWWSDRLLGRVEEMGLKDQLVTTGLVPQL